MNRSSVSAVLAYYSSVVVVVRQQQYCLQLRRCFSIITPTNTNRIRCSWEDKKIHNSNHNSHHNSHYLRSISTVAAKSILGFTKHCQPTIKELRSAYFEAAKLCHPDKIQQQVVQQQQVQRKEIGQENGTTSTNTTTTPITDFRDITAAYEHLLNQRKKGENGQGADDYEIPLEEEQIYRQACLDVLGIPADIVEESKQNPMFRHWLDGNTDGAQYWRSFFAVHGGLAQKLRPPDGYLTTSPSNANKEEQQRRKSESRRKRIRK